MLCTTAPVGAVVARPKIPANGVTNGLLVLYIQVTKGARGLAPRIKNTNRKPSKSSIAPKINEMIAAMCSRILRFKICCHSRGILIVAYTSCVNELMVG